jgi:hypothetical protein
VLGAAALMPNDFALERSILNLIYSGVRDSPVLEQAAALIAQYLGSTGFSAFDNPLTHSVPEPRVTTA